MTDSRQRVWIVVSHAGVEKVVNNPEDAEIVKERLRELNAYKLDKTLHIEEHVVVGGTAHIQS